MCPVGLTIRRLTLGLVGSLHRLAPPWEPLTGASPYPDGGPNGSGGSPAGSPPLIAAGAGSGVRPRGSSGPAGRPSGWPREHWGGGGRPPPAGPGPGASTTIAPL